jgi:hypothetical protein
VSSGCARERVGGGGRWCIPVRSPPTEPPYWPAFFFGSPLPSVWQPPRKPAFFFGSLFIGPSDLAASLGHLGNPAASEVVSVIKDALRRILATVNAVGSEPWDPSRGI